MRLTVPSASAWMAVSIFIASSVHSTSPAFTGWPSLTEMMETMPGMGAPTCFGLPGSALGWAAALRLPASPSAWRFSTFTTRGSPFSSKNTLTNPSSSSWPMSSRRMCGALPFSSSTEISSPACMP